MASSSDAAGALRRPRDRQELAILGGCVLVLVLLGLFIALAGAVGDGDTRHFDERILSALRQDDNPAALKGPRWLLRFASDITALGSMTVVGLTIAVIAGYLVLQGFQRYAVFILVASVGGWWLNWLLKELFDRARPDVVPHLQEVVSSSFPSGHALTSAAVYVTLGALLMRIAGNRLAKCYCLATALLVTFLVGSSRVLLGVHYPTDVLAGWLMGLAWATFCWTIEQMLDRRAGLRRERRQHGE